MISSLHLYVISTFFFASTGHAASLGAVRQSLFKIQVTSQTPNYRYPWRFRTPEASSGSGFYIGDGRILTNAHVVAHGRFIKVLRDGDSQDLPAQATFIAHDADLAILEVDDPKALKDVQPLRFGGIPKLRTPVSTLGYPSGGEQLSITDGIVSRIEYRTYAHSGSHQHLLVQVDAAINPGNSGGPVVQGNQVVGVAFQTHTTAENTGYIIPTLVIQRFLRDIEDGHYDQHPIDGLTLQSNALSNPSAMMFFGLPPGSGGVRISNVAPWSFLAPHLRKGDIITRIDNLPIGPDGKIPFHGERVDFRTTLDLRQLGDIVSMQVYRQGKSQSLRVKVEATRPHYRKDYLYDRQPDYYAFGGFVFTTLSRNFLSEWGRNWYSGAPLLLRFAHAYSENLQGFSKQEDLIVVAARLPHPINSNETLPNPGLLTKVGKIRPKNLKELREAIQSSQDEYLVFEIAGQDNPIVLPRALALEKNSEILAQYDISPDHFFAH